MPDSDLSVSAILLPELHILTFVADDDTFVQEYAFGTPIEEVAVGDKLGYTFEGWDVELPTTMPAQDLVVNAVWSINVHTFSYTTDGRTVSVKYSYGDSVKVPGNPEKYGHHFVGWSDTVPQTMPDCDVKINSVWEPNTYCVTIISDEEIYDKVYIQYGDSIVLPKVKKFGYRFSGWNKKFPATMPAKDFTLTAQFKPKGELFVYSKDHVLYIDGVEKDAQVIVVDVLGRVAYHGKSHEIDLENDGDYIVMCRGQVVKTFVK